MLVQDLTVSTDQLQYSGKAQEIINSHSYKYYTMADLDKNILITPNRGQAAVPSIVFTGQNNTPLTLSVGNAGQLIYSAPIAGTFFTIGNTVSDDIFNITDSVGAAVFKVSTTEIVANLPITGAAAPLQLDVHGQADAANCVYTLRSNQTAINPTYIKDSKDLEVTVNGARYTAYTSQRAFAFMPMFEVDSKTFRVRQNRLIIYNAPEIGAKITVVVRKSSTTAQTRRYPFSAATIGLGD